MSQLDSFSDILELYWSNRKLLKNWTFIVATTDPNNINLYRGMDEIEGIRERLFTPFANERVNIINKRIIKQHLRKKDSRVGMIKNISFDTQTVSYIERYYKDSAVPHKGFDTVVKLLNGSSFGIDHVPYTFENMLFDTSRKDYVEQTLFAFEMLCSENAKKEKVCQKRVHAVLSLYEKDSVILSRTKELYKMVYLALLKMSQIQLIHRNLSVDKKLHMFIDYVATKMCKIMQPEINLAKSFFTNGSNCTFFSKIQVGNKNILAHLKNMTWDLLHLRFMDYSSSMLNGKKADALIPYFFTYDKRLQDIRECYSLQTLAVNYKNHSVIPIYVFNDGIFDIAKEYLTYEKHRERTKKITDINTLINICEQELMKLV